MTTQCAQVATLKLCVFCNDTATTEIYTLSLHDALPIFVRVVGLVPGDVDAEADVEGPLVRQLGQAQDVPVAAVEGELAVAGLAVVGEEEEAEVHAGSPSKGTTGRSESSSTLPSRRNSRSTVSFLR